MFNSLILPDGRQLPDEKVAICHVAVDTQVSAPDQLLPGGVYPGKLTVKLLDPEGQLQLTAGDRVQLLRVDEQGNARKAGVFFLEKPERIGAQTLVLKGFDAVGQLEKDLSQWLAGLTGWPYTLTDFAQMVANRCGLAITPGQLPNGDYPVQQFSAIATGRQLMRWICQACCRFCRANPEGVLEMGWFTDSGVTLEPTGESFYYRGALSYADYTAASVDGVQLRLADGKNSYLWPETEGENPWILTANPVFSELSERTAQALAVIAGELAGLEYTPFCVTVPAREDLMPGQTVQVRTPGGGMIRSCILKQSRDGARDTLSADGRKRLGTAMSAEDKAALEALNAAMSAVEKQTQEEIFRKLTDGGVAEGLFLHDGQVYINASYLVTGVLRSADGKTFYLDLDEGILKGQFEELTIAGKTVKELAKDTLEEQTQEEAFDKLTKKGKLEGLFMKDGHLYINASYLVTGVLRSADEKTFYLDLDEGILKGQFEELTIAGKTVKELAKDTLEEQTQEEVFDKLTKKGALQGLFMQDGQMYLNASYLAAGVIQSADGTVEIDLAKNTVTIHTEDGKLVLAAGGLYGYGRDGVQTLILKPGTGSGSATLLNSFQSAAGLTVAAGKAGSVLTLGQPGASTVLRGSSVTLLDKTVEWKSNGDGTYSLIGR